MTAGGLNDPGSNRTPTHASKQPPAPSEYIFRTPAKGNLIDLI